MCLCRYITFYFVCFFPATRLSSPDSCARHIRGTERGLGWVWAERVQRLVHITPSLQAISQLVAPRVKSRYHTYHLCNSSDLLGCKSLFSMASHVTGTIPQGLGFCLVPEVCLRLTMESEAATCVLWLTVYRGQEWLPAFSKCPCVTGTKAVPGLCGICQHKGNQYHI